MLCHITLFVLLVFIPVYWNCIECPYVFNCHVFCYCFCCTCMYCLYRLVGLDLTIKILKLSYSYSEPRSTADDYMSGGGRRHHYIRFKRLVLRSDVKWTFSDNKVWTLQGNVNTLWGTMSYTNTLSIKSNQVIHAFLKCRVHRRRKRGRRGRTRGPNILSSCRFGPLFFLIRQLFYNPDIEILRARFARECFSTLLSFIIWNAVN